MLCLDWSIISIGLSPTYAICRTSFKSAHIYIFPDRTSRFNFLSRKCYIHIICVLNKFCVKREGCAKEAIYAPLNTIIFMTHFQRKYIILSVKALSLIYLRFVHDMYSLHRPQVKSAKYVT